MHTRIYEMSKHYLFQKKKQHFYFGKSYILKVTKSAMIFNLQTSKTRKIGSQNIYYARTSDIIDFCVAKLGPTRLTRDTSLEMMSPLQ